MDKMQQAQELYDEMSDADKQINEDYFFHKKITHQERQEKLNQLTEKYKENLKNIFKKEETPT